MTSSVTGAEWREALAAGSFEEAHRLFLLSAEEDGATRQALAALSDVQELVREKSWGRARRRVARLEEPPPLVDWSAFTSELELLESSSRRLDRREVDEALETLDGATIRWFTAEAANQRGTALALTGQLAEARNEFGTAVELDSRHYRALTNLGNSCLEAGEIDEAIDCYRKALTVNDEFANAHHNLGVAYRKQGKVGQSVRQLRRAQRLQQRAERERDRERVAEGSGPAGMKALRWTLIALVALVIVVLLNNRGFI